MIVTIGILCICSDMVFGGGFAGGVSSKMSSSLYL